MGGFFIARERAMNAESAWRLCIDFGTAASKACFCLDDRSLPAEQRIAPLEIGSAAGDANAYLAPSYLLFGHERIHFGSAALEQAAASAVSCDPLHSFKTFLAASDLPQAINLKLRRNVDPLCDFSQRDALVLYVAYLLRLSELAADSAGLPTLTPRRYAYPLWRPGDEANRLVHAIFNEAATVAASLDSLHRPGGLERRDARDALDAARRAPADARVEGAIFEALATAETHLVSSEDHRDYVLVFDMGAGTTDFAAFERSPDGPGEGMREIANARRTTPLACDAIDRILVGHCFDRISRMVASASHARLWRMLFRRARLLKETLFRDGFCDLEFDGRKARIGLRQFNADRAFIRFAAGLRDAYARALDQLAASAGTRHAVIGVVLAGGGASLAFVQELAASTSPKRGRALRVEVAPLTPAWTRAPAFSDSFRKQFPQLATSIGGALARMPATVSA